MKSTRLEAFSDGVIAIIITIMVLELKVPHEPTLEALLTLWPIFFSYVLSFLLVAIYWVNHHHLIHLVHKVDGFILWTNMHLLFWLSLVPFVTAYMGETRTPFAVAMYGGVQFACSVAFYFLRLAIARAHKVSPEFNDLNEHMIRKVHIAQLLYAGSVLMAFISIPLALFLMALPAAMYFVPSREIEACEEKYQRSISSTM